MELPEYTEVGKIIGTHGFKGDLVLAHSLSSPKEFMDWEAIMLSWNEGSYIPYFIEKVKPTSNNEIHIKLEDVNDLETAKTFTQAIVFASPLVKVKSLQRNKSDSLIGYFVNDRTLGNLGQIINVKNSVGQDFLEVGYKGKSLLIPVVDTFINKVSPEKNTIIVTLPDGYLDVFLD
jgi:16S rRNA processing protein RimM